MLGPGGRAVVGYGSGRAVIMRLSSFLSDGARLVLNVDNTYSSWQMNPFVEELFGFFLVAVLSRPAN